MATADRASTENTDQVSPGNLVCAPRLLGLLTAIYLALGTLYALYTPLWQAPDEPAHFNYVKYLAEEKQLPVLREGDYLAAYLEEIKARKFPAAMSVDSVRYEFWQPPLYYSLAALVYMAAKPWPLASQVLALRFLSLSFGAGVLWIAYRIVREIFPDNDVLALSTAAFGAAVPMHVAMTAAINNDTLAELILSASLLCCIRFLKRASRFPGELASRHSERSEESCPYQEETLRSAQGDIRKVRLLIVLGVLIGLGLLTKSTTAISVAPALLSLWFALRRSSPKEWLEALLFVFGPAVAISGGWFLRNARTYGWDDPLIWKRHAEVVVGQLTTAEYVAAHGWDVWLREFLRTTFHSFWAQFGWMAVPIDRRLYLLLFCLSGLVALGLVLFIVRQWRGWRLDTFSPARLSRQQWRMLAVVALAAGLTTASYLWYNRRFVQFQGRYLFPAIVPLGLAFALGWAETLSRGYEVWLAALLSGTALVFALKGFVTGDFNRLPIALLAAGAVGFLVKQRIAPCHDRWFMMLIYAALLALTAASPFLFIVPYL